MGPATRRATLGVAGHVRPLLAGGQVADDGIVPDVDALAFIAGQRNGHAPLDIAMGRSRSSRLSSCERVKFMTLGRQCSFRPSLSQATAAASFSAPRSRKKCSAGRISMLVLPQNLHARPDERCCVVDLAAVVALVTAYLSKPQVRAGSLHVAVGQPLFAIQAVQLVHLVQVDDLIVDVAQEDLLGDGPVVLRVGLGEQRRS